MSPNCKFVAITAYFYSKIGTNYIDTKIKQASKNLGLNLVEDALFRELTSRSSWQDTWVLEMTSVILDPLLCVPVPVHIGGRTIYILVKKGFSLTAKEVKTLRKRGVSLRFGDAKFTSRMSQLLTKRLTSGECIQSLVVNPIKGRRIVACRNIEKLRQAWGAALTVYTGLLTFLKGEKPLHSSVARKGGKVISRRTSSSFPLLTLWTHFIRHMPDVEESKMVKILKLSLCGSFSTKTNQEIPEGFEDSAIPLMPTFMAQWVESKCRSKNDVAQLYFSIQQSKGLLARVPDSFLEEGLKKHKAGICRPVEDTIPRDTELYEKMKAFASSRFGAFVAEHYDATKTRVPLSTACIGCSRQKGGNRADLKSSGAFINTSDPYFQSPRGRMEPLVIGLFGAPGSGKSTRIRGLCNSLQQSLFPHCKSDEDLTYSRSCATQHWDGYNGQPIVILDDFGQDHDRRDVVEFAQLVSTNQYFLPMADLAEKGTSFTSPIIIVTSNMHFGDHLCANGRSFCEDPAAIWRRFHLPYMVVKYSDGLQSRLYPLTLEEIHSGSEHNFIRTNEKVSTRTARYRDRAGLFGKTDQTVKKNYLPFSALDYDVAPDSLTDTDMKREVLKTFSQRVKYHRDNCQGKWVQQIRSVDIRTVRRDSEVSATLMNASGGLTNVCSSVSPGLHSYIQFPLEPPAEVPVVEVVALAEPAKVRCITVGESNLKCLQPLQMAMHASLSHYPEFSLTNGVRGGRKDEEKLLIFRKMQDEIRRIHDPDGIWLSGDYTAATDNLPLWVTEALLEGLLEHIEDEPTKRWARYESGQHFVMYPESSGIEPALQTSGQLMGSLLSFPLLCMANAFIVEYSGIKPGSYLVNGDDIVASTTQESIDSWKTNAPRIGLSLSLGKNFVSNDFCTVNSQFFCKEEGIMSIRHTGKTGLLVRARDAPIGRSYADFQDYYGNEDIYRQTFIRHNLEALKHTPQSLQVPLSHGGLGSSFTHGVTINQKLAKEVWVTTLMNRITRASDAQFHTLTGYCPLRIPYLLVDDREEIPNDQAESVISDVKSLFLPEEELDEKGDEKAQGLTHRQVAKVRDQIRSDSHFSYPLRFISQMTELKVQDLPSLESVRFRTHFVRKNDFQTLRYKYLSAFASELACYVKGRPIGSAPETELSLSAYVEALSAKTLRALTKSGAIPAEDVKKMDDVEDEVYLTSILDAICNEACESLTGDGERICNEEFFLSYDRAIVGHSAEQGSKGIPGVGVHEEPLWLNSLTVDQDFVLKDNPWGSD